MSAASRLRRLGRWLALLFGLLALALLVLRAFYADVYRIESDSMAPELFGPGPETPAEWVLVRFEGAGSIERFDLVVVRTAGGRPIVKRVVGLPGERVQLEGGDLLIDGERLGAEVARPLPIDVFREDAYEFAGAFQLQLAPEGPWRQQGEHWELDAREVPLGSNAGMSFLRRDLLDSWIDDWDDEEEGAYQVADGILELEFQVAGPGGRLRFELREEGDTFQALVEPLSEERARLSILRANATILSEGDRRPEQLWQVIVPLATATWHRLRFANVDNSLVLEIAGAETRAELTYERNVPRTRPRDDSLPQDRSAAREDPLDRLRRRLSQPPRVGLGGESIRARIRGVVVSRDRHWLPLGQFGSQAAVDLGPDEFFLLGDNSANSTDGRHFGPVEARDVVGRPVAVVWPWARLRRVGVLR